MSLTRRTLFGLAPIALLATSACHSSNPGSADKPLRLLASSVPHAEIINHLQSTGAIAKGAIELTEITGDLDPNEVLEAGDVDANFFQHVPYQDAWSAERKVDNLVAVASVHVEPLGLYSRKVTDLAQVRRGTTVALSNNITNYVRGLLLLQQAGLITINATTANGTVDYTQVTEKDITSNPHGLTFRKIAPPSLPGTLDDAKIGLSIINGNYALEGGLNPATDALVLETAKNNPYANVLTVTRALVNDPRVKALATALTSAELASWITQQYRGAVLPVAEK